MTSPVPVREYDVAARTTDVFGRVLCNARTHHFIVDGPVQNGCPGEELTPPELFLSSVASCGVELVQVIARDTNVNIGAVTVTVHGTVDRSRQARSDVTTFNSLRMDFTVSGTDGASAAALVEGFRRR
ncbi:MAG TPA: OsmC family protein [Gemmatimonadaceae bacterium]